MVRPPRRFRATISYDGTDFHGWQIQHGLATIQGVLVSVLGELEGSPVKVTGSGRTDAGVHALAQVAAFTLTNPIPVQNLRHAVNRQLPPAIRLLEVSETEPHFHPRYHAAAKTYEYRIWRGEICSPFDQRFLLHHPYPLFLPAMKTLAPLLAGTHDFSAFAASDDKDELGLSKIRTVFSSELDQHENLLTYRVRGNGFLKHMVRNIMGTLLEVGKANLDEAGLSAFLRPGFLDEPGARKAGPRVPACGLFLVSVEYPDTLLNPPPRPVHAGPSPPDEMEE